MQCKKPLEIHKLLELHLAFPSPLNSPSFNVPLQLRISERTLYTVRPHPYPLSLSTLGFEALRAL